MWQTNCDWLEKVWRRRVADRQKAGNTPEGNFADCPLIAAESICRDDANDAIAAAQTRTADASAAIDTAILSAANFARDIGAAIDPHHPPFHSPERPPEELAETLRAALYKIACAKSKI